MAMLLAAGYGTLTAAPYRERMIRSCIRSPTSSRQPIPIYADIYYLDQQPAKSFRYYSHNPYQFTPNVQADIAPGATPGSHSVVMLSNPDQYSAMVTVSTGTEPGTPQLHCALVVDGKVVISNDGAKGVICSQRTW